jgi:outer membrane lipoprotein-sorting protein
MRLAVFLLVAVSSFASAESEIDVDEIVSRHIQALGGIERLRAIRSIRMSGRVTAGGGREALVIREILRPDKIRTEFTLQGVTGVYAFDGARGWKVSPFEGSFAPEPMDEEEASQVADQADIEGPLVDWRAKGHRVELKGKETVDGRELYVLEVTLESGRTVMQFLDSSTLLRARATSERLLRGNRVVLETTFGDYRAVEGVAFPHSIETGAAGRPRRLRIRIEAIEINPSLEESGFRMPPAVP